MSVALTQFESISFEGQQRTSVFGYTDDKAFPLALRVKSDREPTLEDAIAHISALNKSGDIFRLVQQYGGAVLLCGLPITTPNDYSRIAHAFGFSPHEEIGRPPIRTVLVPNVKTANEGPPELPIRSHNEYGWSTHNPAWLTFLCLKVPESGGATPIISSIRLAWKLKKEAPDFLKQLLERGVKYVYRYGREEVKSNTGASIFAAYGQHVKENDDKATIKQKVEAETLAKIIVIQNHLESGQATWFGNLTSAWGRARHHGTTQVPFLGDDGSYHPHPLYGDGSPISAKPLDFALNIAEEMQVDLYWQKGDVVLLDNYAVMHSRRPQTGKRTVLAALWDDVGHERVGDFEEGRF